MKEGNNIKKFSSVDIERYHKGQLSDKERHDLEKAALDDPFLADALEGYSLAAVNATDINDLRNRLSERILVNKTVPAESKHRPFYFLRAAAAIILIAGFGWIAYQFGFNNKKLQIAQNKDEVAKEKPAGNTDTSTNLVNQPVSTINNDQQFRAQPKAGDSERNNAEINKYKPVSDDKVANGRAGKKGEVSTGAGIISRDGKADQLGPVPIVTAPLKTDETDKKETIVSKPAADDKYYRKDPDKDAAGKAEEKRVEKELKDLAKNSDEQRKKSAQPAQQNYDFSATNKFRGRVTDATNTGVPFANVTNVQDNMGTYTDANGNFILTSADSILNVQVRSVGFESNQSQLRFDNSGNHVVMQEDRRSLNEVVVNNTKPNTAARNRNANITLNEAKPADGWEKYDSYLANNVNMPDDFKAKKNDNNSVQVSFEVNKNGDPINIRIEKSLCSSCDKEAIRLIKDGPRWIRNAGNKERTKVTINF